MYYHKITEYEIKCCMHSHHGVPRAPSSRGELYGHKTLFLNDFPIFFYYPNGTWTHPPTSKLFLDFWNFFNFAKPLSRTTTFMKFHNVMYCNLYTLQAIEGNDPSLSLVTVHLYVFHLHFFLSDRCVGLTLPFITAVLYSVCNILNATGYSVSTFH